MTDVLELDELTLSAPEPASVDFTERTVTGVLVPAGDVIGNTSAGPTRFVAGAVSWPDELRRVKLLREHQRSDALGYATRLEWVAGALVGTFYVPPSPEGDRALRDADNGVRDGLSVGVFGITGTYDRDGVLVVTASMMREGSLCVIPAFDDSRVSVVATHGKETPSMTTDATTLEPQTLTVPQLTASEIADELVERLRAGVQPTLTGPNAGPSDAALDAGAAATGISLSRFTELVAAHEVGDVAASTELRAALTDVIPGDNPGAFRPAYLAELWDGSPYARRFIDTATTVKPLPKALKIIGQRWVTRPEVADYTGNKTAVPSGEVELEDVEVTVGRLAGAHDVDRAFIDLGSPEWLASYFDAQTESYKRKSDAKAAALTFAGGTPLVETATDGDTNPATFTSLMEGVVEGVVSMAGVGESVDYVAMAPGLVRELFGITTMDALAYMNGSFQLGGGGQGALGGVSFFTSIGLTGRQFIVGAKSASRWHEFATPIRVQAVNVANGGIDLGVFGYYAGYVRNPAAVRVGTVSAAG